MPTQSTIFPKKSPPVNTPPVNTALIKNQAKEQRALFKDIEASVNKPTVLIDERIDPSKRPLMGLDIEYFRSRHQLHAVDVIYALCIQNGAAYNKMLCSAYLPYTTEMLIRLYDMYPEHTPWRLMAPKDAFEFIYGDVIQEFKGSGFEDEARIALFRRFAACCGRSLFTAYRWVQFDGASKRGVAKVFSRIATLDNARAVLEDLARQMYHVRGYNFDGLFPMPSLENPPVYKKRGPPPKKQLV